MTPLPFNFSENTPPRGCNNDRSAWNDGSDHRETIFGDCGDSWNAIRKLTDSGNFQSGDSAANRASGYFRVDFCPRTFTSFQNESSSKTVIRMELCSA